MNRVLNGSLASVFYYLLHMFEMVEIHPLRLASDSPKKRGIKSREFRKLKTF